MGWRKIVVDGAEYRWKCGESFVTIQTKSGKKVAVERCEKVAGIDEDWDYATRKGYG